MANSIRVSILQKDIVWGDPQKNRERFGVALSQSPQSDLYILPEMFSTGFCSKTEFKAEPVENSSLTWMQEQARTLNAALAGSIAIKEGSYFYNRFYFIFPSGKYTCYDKRHLFTFGGEDNFFKGGKERKIVEYKGVRILLQICYDLRFPVFSRNNNDYDMAIYVASWPASRAKVWSALLKARAIENQCYVIGVNRVGDDIECHYSGNSAIYDAYGESIAACTPEAEETATAEISLEALNEFRAKFPVLNDRDTFKLELK